MDSEHGEPGKHLRHREYAKNAVVATLVAATLVTGVIVLAPGSGPEPRRTAGPVARAQAATLSGAPAAAPDLTALITDRERWLRKNPEDEASWAVLGNAYVQRGTWQLLPKAEHALRRSLELRPAARGNNDAVIGLAALANARHDHVTARAWAQRAQKQRPRRWTVYPALIDAYSGLGDEKSASAAFDRLGTLYTGPRGRALAARVYRDFGWREDAAAQAYDAVAVARSPQERSAALHTLGDLSWERGDLQEALTSYDNALRLTPGAHGPLASRARVRAALGHAEPALRDYRAALAAHPAPEYAAEAGELYTALGRTTEAGALRDALRATLDQAAAHGVNVALPLARWETAHGSATSAVDRLRGQWQRGHRGAPLADALAWALFRAGRPEDALPYARIAEKAQRTPMNSYHLGEIERALGQYGAARRHLTQALRINPHFSPRWAPAARESLGRLGEPPMGRWARVLR
ncbi:tetratricopeptide repeat protein [Streptomyces sp. NPDC057638]|uniref:tetratricopeptide repeat protein n=1 Tax=Streptomyces sp. NPDC057638 TaxID=3346190 RepID=UPI0036994F96